jgi:hypothetical protein
LKEIDTLTLENVIQQLDIALPLVVKLDTQGSELDILKGAEESLRRHRIIGIEAECTLLAEPLMKGSGRFSEMIDFLEPLGFELLEIKPFQGPRSHGNKSKAKRYAAECDVIFALRRDVLDSLAVSARATALGFLISNEFFEEALSLLKDDKVLFDHLHELGACPRDLMKYIRSEI